ncbi:hypothetical protein ACFE04_000872 [Oxalis oulophora]
MSPTKKDHIKYLWRDRLDLALRSMIACTIVGCTILYGPKPLQQLVAFPAFSYATAILIVSDVTLGDTLKGFWQVIYATIQVMIPSMFTLWVVRPERFNESLAAVAVATTSFAMALPGSTSLLAKRIGFGQCVIVYVGVVIEGKQIGVFKHPLTIACSTLLGATASVLAMLFPFPRLAYWQVKKSCRLYAENAIERLDILVKAFTNSKPNQTTLDLDPLSEAKFVSKIGAAYLQTIKHNQKGMLWERPEIGFLKPYRVDAGGKLEDIEIPIRGMEIALASGLSSPAGIIDQQKVKEALQRIKAKISIKLEQANHFLPFNSTTAPVTSGELLDDDPLWMQDDVPDPPEDLSVLFFLNCMQLLEQDCIVRKVEAEHIEAKQKTQPRWKTLFVKPSSECLLFAVTCSVSLGLAVFFGLLYDKKQGYWSGLTIALSFATGREAIFTAANARAQGTAMGSVYGIICCSIFQTCVGIRFLPLLPWIIFTSLLRHSRMYGQAGGISAVIGASLILGRKHYGTPTEFAISRIAEATIGLICFIAVHLLLQPVRAATSAKARLSQTLSELQESIRVIDLQTGQKNINLIAKSDKYRKLKSSVGELQKFIKDAEVEPNFWFRPFYGDCYREIHKSLSKMVDILLFVVHETEFLSELSRKFPEAWEEIQEPLNEDIELFKNKVCKLLLCIQEIILIKSLSALEIESTKNNKPKDLESDKLPSADMFKNLNLDDHIEEITTSFTTMLKELANSTNIDKEDEKLKTQMVLCFGSFGFCITSLMRETIEIEKHVLELLKWENPTVHINLCEISWKISTLYKNEVPSINLQVK